jgi:hypothetical protein
MPNVPSAARGKLHDLKKKKKNSTLGINVFVLDELPARCRFKSFVRSGPKQLEACTPLARLLLPLYLIQIQNFRGSPVRAQMP